MTKEPIYECNGCDWQGPARDTVHPKHDDSMYLCPECNETVGGPVEPLTQGPMRIQLKRTKGWRMPPNTVKVDRTSRFGNPFRVGLIACGCRSAGMCDHNYLRCDTAAEAVEAYAEVPRSLKRLREIREALRGKNLACWCPLGQPCHADVLLEIANG